MKDSELIARFGAGIIVAGVAFVAIVFGLGYASSRFWNLFAPEMFGLPPATWLHGVGFAGFVACARACLGSLSVRSAGS